MKHCFCSLNDWELYFFKIVFKKSLSLQKTWIKSHASVRLHHTRRRLGCTGGTLKTEAKKRERRQATTLHDFHKSLSAQVFFFLTHSDVCRSSCTSQWGNCDGQHGLNRRVG